MPAECNDPSFSTTFITAEMKDVTRIYDKSLVGSSPQLIFPCLSFAAV